MGVVIAFAFFRKAGGCEGDGVAEAVGVVDGVGVGGEERGRGQRRASEASSVCYALNSSSVAKRLTTTELLFRCSNHPNDQANLL